jgi:glycosyltransferase involved in cell wall biosynthesis
MREITSVLLVGPGLQVRGGISSVERLIVEHAGSGIGMRHIATMEDGSRWHKIVVFWRSLAQVRRALRSDEPMVVHIHFSARGSAVRKVILAWLTLRAGRPLILHAHSGSFDQFYERQPIFIQGVLSSVLGRADKLVVLSSYWREFYSKRCGVDGGRIIVLHNPVALPKTVPDRTQRRQVQLLFLGRLSEHKGAFDLLRAYLALPQPLRERTRLVFAGDGKVEELRAAARVAGDSVEVHSWIDTQRRDALLEQSDVFVLPSYYEGVPMALLEAMAHGMPVITTKVGGIPDIVHDQVEGLLLTPGEHENLVDALTRMIEDRDTRLAFGRNARARAEHFDIDRYSTDLLRLYRQMLRQHERVQPGLPSRVL